MVPFIPFCSAMLTNAQSVFLHQELPANLTPRTVTLSKTSSIPSVFKALPSVTQSNLLNQLSSGPELRSTLHMNKSPLHYHLASNTLTEIQEQTSTPIRINKYTVKGQIMESSTKQANLILLGPRWALQKVRSNEALSFTKKPQVPQFQWRGAVSTPRSLSCTEANKLWQSINLTPCISAMASVEELPGILHSSSLNSSQLIVRKPSFSPAVQAKELYVQH